ncbi:MAG: hypothetical protein ISQ08_02400 [Planctomycetes bacterium]|nr:hypothetical protein [Planctomycetota bacterium]
MGKKRRSLEAEGLPEGGLTHNPFAAALGGRGGGQGAVPAVPKAGAAAAPGEAPPKAGRRTLLLRREVKGTGGHPVCRVLGLDPGVDGGELAREASRALGCRVQLTDEGLVVGLKDPERVAVFFAQRGFDVKRAN